LPPILGCTNRPAGPVPQEPFRAGQTVVVQPNVITTDADESKRAGVQVGEMIRVTKTGFERLHKAERKLFRAG